MKMDKPFKRIPEILCTVIFVLVFCSCGRENTTLLISDGTVFESKEYFPDFSWETTPMYYMFGDSKRLLEPEEVNFVADRTGFLCIEKSHGLDPLGAAELGAKHEATAFKQINPDIKVLFYFNSAWAWPFTSYNKYFTHEHIDEHPELKKFLIIDPETGELEFNLRRRTFLFDVLNPEFRQWWVDKVTSGVEVSGCDGVFVDQMHGFFSLREERKEEVLRAMGEMMADLKDKFGPDKILLANNANDDIARFVYPAIDATMFEHYKSQLTSKENFLKEWDDMLKNAKEGKISVFRIGVEHDRNGSSSGSREERFDQMVKLSKEKLEFYLACYLIGAQPYAYFQYGWGWNLDDGSLVDFPDLQKPLGAPKGAYERVDPAGWEFTREFEHASVWVDTEAREGKIEWR